MSVGSQWFSRTSNAGGAPTRENNVVSLGGTIGARGLPPGPDLRPYKSLTCSDAMRTGPNGRHRGLLRLTECSHHVGSSGICQPVKHRRRALIACSPLRGNSIKAARLAPDELTSSRSATIPITFTPPGMVAARHRLSTAQNASRDLTCSKALKAMMSPASSAGNAHDSRSALTVSTQLDRPAAAAL